MGIEASGQEVKTLSNAQATSVQIITEENSLKALNIPRQHGGQDGRTVSLIGSEGIGLIFSLVSVKFIHESIIRSLKEIKENEDPETQDPKVPDVLPNPDLKAIAMKGDTTESIKVGCGSGSHPRFGR